MPKRGSGREPDARWEYPVKGLPERTPEGERVSWIALEKPNMAFGFTERDGRLVWSSFAFLGGKKDELTSDGIRGLNIAKWADRARQALAVAMAAKRVKNPKKHAAALKAERERLVKPRRGLGRSLTDEELNGIAVLYREAKKARPHAPLAYIQAKLGRNADGTFRVVKSTVKRRVDRARETGHLKPNE